MRRPPGITILAQFSPAESLPGPRRRGVMVAAALGAFAGAIAVAATGSYIRRVTGAGR